MMDKNKMLVLAALYSISHNTPNPMPDLKPPKPKRKQCKALNKSKEQKRRLRQIAKKEVDDE